MPSEEYTEKIKILRMQEDVDLKRHNFKMEELHYQRESDKIKHDDDMLKQKTKSDDIREIQQLKQRDYNYFPNG